jgi:twitching motility two-component system response regulator PilG
LEAVGFPCTEFGGSAEALSPLFENEPDAIFCEIDLPKLDGYEFCHLLRRSSCFRATPIVLLGRAGETLDRRRAKLVGVTDYLGEPFDEGEFFETLAIHLRTPPPRRDLPEKFAADSGFFASSGKDRGSSHQDRRNFGQEENRSL